MSGLEHIRTKVADSGAVFGAPAILREIGALLENLAGGGEGGVVDLRGVPLGPADYEMLQRELGQGEVTARLEAAGPSEVRETSYAGVWWVTHRDQTEKVIAECIEVSRVPAILASQPEDIRAASLRLEKRLGGDAAPHN
jgi:hydrogenase-1 operon protein HyaF